MTESAYYINERPNRHCVVKGLSNLVKLDGRPDVGQVYHEYPTSSKPLSRNQRCIRYLDCFRKVPSCRREGFSHEVGQHDSFRCGTFTQAVFITRNLDRILKDNQGGCLYEWPDSQIYGVSSMMLAHLVPRRVASLVTVEVRPNPGLNPERSTIWQKPGIGVRPSVRSSSLMALPRGKDNRVLSERMPRAVVLQAGSNLPRKGARVWEIGSYT